MEPYRPRDVSNTQTVLPLIFNARRPRLRRGLLQQRRIVLGRLKRRALWGGSFPPWSFLPIGIGERPASDSLVFWWSRLPPQSFLPVGIGEAAPVTNFALFDFVSLHSLSNLWVSGRPLTDILVDDARDVLHWRRPLCPSRRRLGRRLYLDIDFDLSLDRRLGTAESSRFSPCHPRGASRMADGTFGHST